MKAVHFQILIDDNECDHFYLLEQNGCAFKNLKFSFVNDTERDITVDRMCQCVKPKHKKCRNCVENNVTLFHVDVSDDGISIINKANNDNSRLVEEITEDGILAMGESVMKSLNTHVISGDCRELYHSRRLITIAMSGYFLSQFYKTLINSPTYRAYVLKNFLYWKPSLKPTNNFQCICINVVSLGHCVIDYSWNDKLVTLCLERRELDHAMSWLSTLGGAFSALGEKEQHFAYMAGRTSIEQFRLALRLGDDLIVARCKLYYALSLIQRGYLSRARKIIRQQYQFATTSVVPDNRLIRMCLGIWAKLKFEYRLRKNMKNQCKMLTN